MNSNKIIEQLLKALEAAKEHLEYCGYGDSWERECANAQKLPSQLEIAIEDGKKFLNSETKK